MNTAQAIDDRLAWVKERAARAASAAQISTSTPSVIEQISSPVISPQACMTVEREVVRMTSNMKASKQKPFPPFDIAVSVPAETIDANPLPTKDAQFAALQSIGLLGMKTRADDVLLVIATACKAGVEDLTGREIQALYERRYGRRIESGTISARVSELLLAQRILRRPQTRICTVTREVAAPVYVVMKQTRMVW